jgi:hypothetical protein
MNGRRQSAVVLLGINEVTQGRMSVEERQFVDEIDDEQKVGSKTDLKEEDLETFFSE